MLTPRGCACGRSDRPMRLRAVAEVNLAAIERNAALLGRAAGGAALCAVVKADGYGHGAVPAARAAIAGGASKLAVATAEEAAELRRGGIGEPILILGAVSEDELRTALAADAELTAWDVRFVEQVAAGVAAIGSAERSPVGVHVKLDSGLGRLGTRCLETATAVAEAVIAAPVLRLVGAMTHFATADSDAAFVARQLAEFMPFVQRLRALPDGGQIVVHAANSAAILRFPETHLDMVRAGVALYGGDPMNADAGAHGLEPALALRSYVAAVKPIAPGQSAGYGRRFVAGRASNLATLPIGYGDGIARAFADNLDVLIGGRRYPVVGMVSMDNITVDLGPETTVAVGDLATLIGTDGSEHQTAEDLARRAGTISYEVLCWISRRVPRHYHRDGVPV